MHTIDAVRASAYRIPTDGPEADGTLAWDSTTLVVVTVEAGDVTGTGWTYADASCVPLVHGKLADTVRGRDVRDVVACWHAMQRQIRNLGRPGLVSCAMSAVDTALWDAAARTYEVPVSTLLGRVRDEVLLYGSGGFTSYDDDRLAAQVSEWVRRKDIPRVKIKIGESWGSDVDRDLHRIALTRETAGPDAEVYVDANGAYPVGLAARVGERLADFGVTWFEEPVSSDDLDGLRRVRAATSADVAAGEYGFDLHYFARMIASDALDCVQVDVTRCGGFTEWQRIAAYAAAHGLEVSAHCAPNLSAHVGAATPNFRHIEWFVDHDRIESELFRGVLDPSGGRVYVDAKTPGHGMTFDRAAAEPYAVREETT